MPGLGTPQDRPIGSSGPGDGASIEAILDAADARLLVETGFAALMHGFVDAAGDIFRGVLAARPDGEAGHVGLALVRLHVGDAEAAVAALRRRPPSDTARLFLALALQRRGDLGEARAILADLAATALEPAQAESAAGLLAALDAERPS